MVETNFEVIKNFITSPEGSEDIVQEAYKKGKNWSFDLRIGDEYFLSGDTAPEKLNEDNRFIIIKPGKFGALITKEVVCIDNNHIGLISVKFSYKQKGLINVSGFHVDPNYQGNIIFTVFNAGPKDIYIKKDEYVFMICFLQLSQGDPSRPNKKGYSAIPVSMIEGLGGHSLTLMENNRRIEQLEFYVKIIAGVALGLLVFALKSIFS